ncbi:hypothetical protein [Methylobacterium sp. Leaf117]|nr:hypothetical protein [Methylobacterium sp. Leaf117]
MKVGDCLQVHENADALTLLRWDNDHEQILGSGLDQHQKAMTAASATAEA